MTNYKVKLCSIHIPDMIKVSNLLHTYSAKEQMSNFGPLYHMFKEKLKEYLKVDDSKEIIITSSGHIALMTATHALYSRSILCPNYTFLSTSASIELQKEKRVDWLQTENNNGMLTVEHLEAIDPRFDTVMAICPLSNIPNLKAISKWCKEHQRKLIIDGAATFGTPGIVNYGDAFCMSFHATKAFPLGEGGILIIDKIEFNASKQYINFGSIENPGINGKVSEYTCAIGIALLDEIDDDIVKRKRNTDLYKSLLNKDLYADDQENTVYSLFPIYFEDPELTTKVFNNLISNGYEVRQYYQNTFPRNVIHPLAKRNIVLPCHPDVTEENIKDICSLIRTS